MTEPPYFLKVKRNSDCGLPHDEVLVATRVRYTWGAAGIMQVEFVIEGYEKDYDFEEEYIWYNATEFYIYQTIRPN